MDERQRFMVIMLVPPTATATMAPTDTVVPPTATGEPPNLPKTGGGQW